MSDLITTTIISLPFVIVSYFSDYTLQFETMKVMPEETHEVITRITICCNNEAGPMKCHEKGSNNDISFRARSSVEATPFAVDDLLWRAYNYCQKST